MAPKLPCFNALVTMRTNCCANKNEDLFRLAGSMDTFNFLHARLCSVLVSQSAFQRGSGLGNLQVAASPYSAAPGQPFCKGEPAG